MVDLCDQGTVGPDKSRSMNCRNVTPIQLHENKYFRFLGAGNTDNFFYDSATVKERIERRFQKIQGSSRADSSAGRIQADHVMSSGGTSFED